MLANSLILMLIVLPEASYFLQGTKVTWIATKSVVISWIHKKKLLGYFVIKIIIQNSKNLPLNILTIGPDLDNLKE